MRWGILATGMIARKFADTVNRMAGEGEKLLAVGSRSAEKAKAFAEEFGIPKYYGSYEELAADPEIDAVYIASPHNGKWSVTMYPAEAAKYFELTPSSGTITKEMILAGGKVEFKVTASTLVPAVTQTVHFNVSIYMGNDWHDANSEFNRKDWKLVREP